MEGSLLKLTLKQRVFLLEFWWKYEYDYEKVCDEFRVSYPSVNIPTRHEIQKLNRIFRENGTVASLPPMKSALKKGIYWFLFFTVFVLSESNLQILIEVSKPVLA